MFTSALSHNEKTLTGTILILSVTCELTGTHSASFLEADNVSVYLVPLKSRLIHVGLMLLSFLQKSQLGSLVLSGGKL